MLAPWLSPQELQRCQRLLTPQLQQRQKVACALLRALVWDYAARPCCWPNWQLRHWGKPSWPQGCCSFNLTHSQGLAALALSPAGELGLDLECQGREVDFLQLGRRYFAAAEAQELQQRPSREFFFEIWTAKEAYIKALGQGLSHPLDQFLTRWQGSWGLFDLQGQPLPWHLSRPPTLAGWSAALVSPRPLASLPEQRFLTPQEFQSRMSSLSFRE